MLSVDELHLLEPLDATAPLAAHMFHELRGLATKGKSGGSFDHQQRVTKPPTGRTEAEIARLQNWRRDHNGMWVSELSRADGTTLRGRFMENLAARARRCEPDAIQLCGMAFGRGRGLGIQSGRPRVGLPLPAAWDGVGVGSYVWHEDKLGRVRAKGHASATIVVFTAEATPR